MPISVSNHFDSLASQYDRRKSRYSYYYDSLKDLLRRYIPPHKHVLEVGCGTGQLLLATSPNKGIGIDTSPQMISIAKRDIHDPHISFTAEPIETFTSSQHFDYIFMVDVIEHLPRLQASFSSIASLMEKQTIFINTMVNPIWEPLLMVAEKLHLKMPEGPHDRKTFGEIQTIVHASGMEITTHSYTLLCPIYIPLFTSHINTYIEPYVKSFCFIEYFVCRKN